MGFLVTRFNHVMPAKKSTEVLLIFLWDWIQNSMKIGKSLRGVCHFVGFCSISFKPSHEKTCLYHLQMTKGPD